MAVETIAPETKSLRRRRALEPYVVQLEAALRLQPREGVPSSKLSIGEIALPLEPWVAARVDPRSGPQNDGADRTELLRESLALWLKSSIDVMNLRRGVRSGSGNLYSLQAELMLDSAFGSALLRELQDSVDGLVKQGELDEAKRFSKFRHQVHCVVRELKQSVAESNATREDEPVGQASDHRPAAAPKSDGGLRETDPEYPVPVRRRRPPAQKTVPAIFDTSRPRYRTEALITLDAVALLAFFLLTGPARMLEKAPRALTHGDFPNAAPLTEIVARPPALYATVDGTTWSAYDNKQKRHFVDGMGSVLLTNGYWGLVLKAPDGHLVAEWLENGGTRLLDVKASTPSDPAVPSATTPEPVAEAGNVARYSRFVP